MPVNFQAARHFIYTQGTLWERALFGWLFEGGDEAHARTALRAYRNPDGGYGHGLEHDITTPLSNVACLEFLTRVLMDTRLPPGDLLDGAADWLLAHQRADGSLVNDAAVFEHPHADHWRAMGAQTEPDAVVGNLIALGQSHPELTERTRRWAARQHLPTTIRAQGWLFMLYHPYDYFTADDGAPNGPECRAATIETIVRRTSEADPIRYYEYLTFAQGPDSEVARATPFPLLTRVLDGLELLQQHDGSWHDEHGLPHWYPYVTINVLLGLRRFGRW